VDLSPTTVTNLNDISIGNSAGDNQTLTVNFTNASRSVSARIIRVQYGGTPTLNIEQGVVEARRRLNLGYVTSGTGTVRIVGGMLVATQAFANGDWSTVGGNDTVGTGFLDQQGGRVLFDRVAVGYYSGSFGLWTLSGGTGSVSHTFAIGNNLGSTGTVVVAGGRLTDTTSLGTQIGVFGNGTMIVSNGSFETTGLTLGYSGGLGNRFEMDGGTSTVSGIITVGRLNGSGGTLLMNGGVLNVTNGTGSVDVSYQASKSSDARLIVSNGTVNTRQLSIGGDAGGFGTGAGEMHLVGGLVSVWSNFYAGAKKGGSTGVVEVAGTGILEVKGNTFTVGQSGGTGRGYFTNHDGGTLRFTGLNNPTITVNSGSSFVTTNATIEFMNAGAANLMGSVSNLITYQGNNTLRLNAATNAALSSYTFQTNNGQRFAFLDLTGGGALLATNVTIGAGGKLTGTGAILARTVTNLGTIAPGHSPGVLTFTNDLTLGASSVLNMELAGTNLNLFDRIAVGGAFALNGALNVSLTNGFNPQFGNSFKIFDFSSNLLSNTFATTTLAPLDTGLLWDTSQLYFTGTLSVVPEPSAFVLLAAGLLGGLAIRRHRVR
jgi:hypothetical protein